MANPQPAVAQDPLLRHAPGGDMVELGRPLRPPLQLVRHVPAKHSVLGRREALLLGLLVLTLHGSVAYWLSQ